MSYKGYRKILVPVDGSKNSFKALDHACRLASCFEADIGILYVMVAYMDFPLYAQLNTSYMPPNLYTDLEQFGKNVLEEAQKQVPPEVKAECYLEIGSPAEVIPDFAAANGYELIVMGSRGLSVIKGLVMGSVSAHVVAHATTPVLIVK